MRKWYNWGLWLLVGAAGLGLVCYPAQAAEAAGSALVQCGTVLLPALFPFLVLSSLVAELGQRSRAEPWLSPVMGALFGVSGKGAPALLLGLVGGYPVGARTVGELYRQGVCSREECSRLLVFCNNCGPAFLLSTAGVAVLGSRRAGWLLWLGHLLGALGVGMLFRRPRRNALGASSPPPRVSPTASAALVAAVTAGARSALQLTAFVTIFGVGLRLLAESGILPLCAWLLLPLLAPLGFTLEGCATLLAGFCEMTRGILALSGQSPTPAVLALCAFLLGWGGLSVHCQTLAVLEGTGLPVRRYLLGKLCHGCLAAGITYGLATLFPEEPELVTLGYTPSQGTFLPGLGAAVAVVVILALWSRNRAGKVQESVVK